MADYEVLQAGKSSEKPCDKTGVRGSNPRSPTTPYWRIVLVILLVSLTKKELLLPSDAGRCRALEHHRLALLKYRLLCEE